MEINELKKLQKELDEQKYYESIKNNCDMSGKMPYCNSCIARTYANECYISQDARETMSKCARSYNEKLEKQEQKELPKNKRNRKSFKNEA